MNMARQIFIVSAQIVDSTGAFHFIDGYPKTFDSNNYNNDVQKAQRRAEGDAYEQWSAFCKRDDRLMQTVSVTTIDGYQVYMKADGKFPDDPEE